MPQIEAEREWASNGCRQTNLAAPEAETDKFFLRRRECQG
jgi:hypothetical protein